MLLFAWHCPEIECEIKIKNCQKTLIEFSLWYPIWWSFSWSIYRGGYRISPGGRGGGRNMNYSKILCPYVYFIYGVFQKKSFICISFYFLSMYTLLMVFLIKLFNIFISSYVLSMYTLSMMFSNKTFKYISSFRGGTRGWVARSSGVAQGAAGNAPTPYLRYVHFHKSFLYKSWYSTISLNACQNIQFTANLNKKN